MDSEKAADILPEIIDDLLSYDETRYKHVLESYFTKDAQLTHPLLNVGGTHNIRKVFRVWTSLNSQQPDIKDYPIFDGYVAIIHLIQHLRPRFFPFFHFEIPSVTVLRLRQDEDTGLLYIYKQEDNWTLEGLIQSVPIVNWWYEKVVRYIMGELITSAGDFLYTANTATSRLTDRAGEVRDTSNIAIERGQIRARSMVNGLSDSVKSQLQFAQENVLNQYNKVRGIQKNDYMIKSKDDDEYDEDDEEGDDEDYEEEEEEDDDNDDNDDNDDDDLQ